MWEEADKICRNTLTVSQENRAIHYAVMFLRGEVLDIKKAIAAADGGAKKLLKKRLSEIEEDLETFEGLNEGIS